MWKADYNLSHKGDWDYEPADGLIHGLNLTVRNGKFLMGLGGYGGPITQKSTFDSVALPLTIDQDILRQDLDVYMGYSVIGGLNLILGYKMTQNESSTEFIDPFYAPSPQADLNYTGSGPLLGLTFNKNIPSTNIFFLINFYFTAITYDYDSGMMREDAHRTGQLCEIGLAYAIPSTFFLLTATYKHQLYSGDGGEDEDITGPCIGISYMLGKNR